jgi:predicted enzyme related to lactoylglutathione lyase
MAQAKFRGRFVWQELMTEDTAAASAFYSRLLGWHGHTSGGDPSYTEFHAGGHHHGVAGMLKTPDSAKAMGAKPMWMPYISVDEVDPAVVELQHLGGKVIRPATDIPNVGRFAVVSDPQGAVFAIMKPMGPPPPLPAPPQLGEFSWLELATTDHEAAFSFYSKLFGWEALHRHDMGPGGTYLIFGADGVQRGGMFKAMGPQASHPAWLPYAAVADADASAKVVTAAGGKIVNGPMDVPGEGRIVQLLDPGGAMFALHAQAKPKAASPPPKPAQAAPPPVPKPAAPAAAVKSAPPPPAKAAVPSPPKPAATPAAKPVAAPAKAPLAPKVASAPAAKKAAAKKPARKTPRKAAKKTAAKKTAAKKAVAKKAVAKKAVAKKKPASKKAAPKKATSKPKAAARKVAVKTKKGKAKNAKKGKAKSAKSAKRKSGKAKRKK